MIRALLALGDRLVEQMFTGPALWGWGTGAMGADTDTTENDERASTNG